jgi:uncharacterized protein (DUF58 family)
MFRWIERFLKKGRTYIIPNGSGFAFGLLFFALLFTGAALNLPLIQLAGFLISILYLSGMVQSNTNLKDLELKSAFSPLSPAGAPLEAVLTFIQKGPDPVRRIIIEARGHVARIPVRIDRIPPGEPFQVTISLGAYPRGQHPFPRIRIWSTHPIGLFRTFKTFEARETLSIHPAPSGELPLPVARGESPESEPEYLEHRKVTPVDPPRSIDWKRFARNRERLCRHYDSRSDFPVILKWSELEALPLEPRLSQMAQWVITLRNTGRPLRIEAPFVASRSGSGDPYAEALRGMAEYREPA